MTRTNVLCAVLPWALALALPVAADEAIQSAVIPDASAFVDALRSQALDLANASRAKAGLVELRRSGVLDEAAQTHADAMLERGFYDHVSPEGETPFDRFLAAGGSRWAVSGENIARCEGCETPPGAERVASFHEGWMESPGHRENILSSGFTRFGFGIAGEGAETYAVQTFSGPGDDGGEGSAAPAELRAAAQNAIDARRADRGLEALEPSPALDAAAEQALAALVQDEDLPGDLFRLLPEDASGWMSLSLLSASRGGAGSRMAVEDAEAFAEGWAEGAEGEPFGGTRASHLGFAARADGDGRKTAVAVLGGRE